MMDNLLNAFAYATGFNIAGFEIKFYAFCLLGGGLVALFLSDYHAHKLGYSMDVFDTMFLIAFPCGVIGARIWYIISTAIGGQSWTIAEMFGITENGIKLSGLAIEGGAIGGALGGILFGLKRRKGFSVWQMADCIVPTILVAQALGRWGNFLNQEVFGQPVDASAYWFLPDWINKNMYINYSGDGQTLYRVPLFFIEAMLNLGGYFVLTRFAPICFGKHYKVGDTLFLYPVWYGVIRAMLEPLRNIKDIMGLDPVTGKGIMVSVYMSIVYVICGLAGIIINHVIRDKAAKKNGLSRQADK
jgi:phosphatidylglycerol---prolipoprotein diacylglyceryl transferase